jgi:hypothetical protein
MAGSPTLEDYRYTVEMARILFGPRTVCLEGYVAHWLPATMTDPGEWTYDSRYDPICPHCHGEGCDVVVAREEFEADALDALEFEGVNPADTIDDLERRTS